MRRFNSEEMIRYWQTHVATRGKIDWDCDFEGLNNVCYPGAPLTFNQYHGRIQRKTYINLLNQLPIAGSEKTALDIGCGTGRWCRILNQNGYQTFGIDLQNELIKLNSVRNPGINFLCSSLQNYDSLSKFDVISSVTVLQHNPFSEQLPIIEKMRSLLKKGGYVIMLENTLDQDPHVFANSVHGWIDKFEEVGFICLKTQKYDFSYYCRAQKLLIKCARILIDKPQYRLDLTPEEMDHKNLLPTSYIWKTLNTAHSLITNLTFNIDSLLEGPLTGFGNVFSSTHCGFLFQSI